MKIKDTKQYCRQLVIEGEKFSVEVELTNDKFSYAKIIGDHPWQIGGSLLIHDEEEWEEICAAIVELQKILVELKDK